jgi:hypothetical protein
MVVTLEEMIRDSAISIVYSDENYHRPSIESEVTKLNAVVRSLLRNEVTDLRKDKENAN